VTDRPAASWTWRESLPVVAATWFVLLIGGSLVLAVGPWKIGGDLPITAQFAATVPFWIAALAGVWWVSRSSAAPRTELGLAVTPLDVVVGAVVGVGVQLVVLPLLYWPLLELLGEDYDAVEREAQKLADASAGTVGTVLFVLMASLVAPLVEELLYRGLLLRSDGWAPDVALAVTTVVFAASHLQLLQFPGLAVFGLAAGLVARRTGRLGPAMVAHIAFNTTTVVQLLLARK